MPLRAEAALCAAVLAVAFAGGAGAEPIALDATRVALDTESPETASVGRLAYRGGIAVTSTDKRLGGLSGLLVTDGGRRLVAVSDAGRWLTARLVYGSDGHLEGIADGEVGPLIDPRGAPVGGSRRGDAEAIARLADGVAVAFEGVPRIWRYPPAAPPFARAPIAIAPPVALRRGASNRGLEALTALADGRLFALAEDRPAGPGLGTGWVSSGPPRHVWSAVSWKREGLFVPTGAATLPDGDVVVLERRFTWIGGLASRIVRVPAARIVAGAALEGEELARLEGTLTRENFEGIDAVSGPGGETRIYLVSDDNFHALQRTLLLCFALLPQGAAGVTPIGR
jgi:hypothetical protein